MSRDDLDALILALIFAGARHLRTMFRAAPYGEQVSKHSIRLSLQRLSYRGMIRYVNLPDRYGWEVRTDA